VDTEEKNVSLKPILILGVKVSIRGYNKEKKHQVTKRGRNLKCERWESGVACLPSPKGMGRMQTASWDDQGDRRGGARQKKKNPAVTK